MGIRSRLAAGLLATTLSLGGAMAAAQDMTPEASPEDMAAETLVVDMHNADGDVVGSASFTENEEGVSIVLQSTSEGSGTGLEEGLHGLHIHETGICDPSGETPFESAGDHFNPTDDPHGGLEDEDSHAGDLGNIEVAANGTFGANLVTDRLTLEPGAENSLADADGSTILIHADEDDLETDPDGDSGDRLACGVIFPADDAGATPAADGPDATPEASPMG